MAAQTASPRNITKPMEKPIMETTRIAMKFAKTLCVALMTVGVVGGSGLAPLADAAVVTTTQPTSPSNAEPVWGQGITINVGADLADALIPATVNLDFAGWRIGDASVGSADRTAVRMHIYDAFGINGDGTVNGAAIGGLVAYSTNTVNLQAAADGTDVFWFFSGAALSKNTLYHYILADNTIAATLGDFSNLIFSDLVVATANPYAGGQAYVQTGDQPLDDLFFRVQSSFEAVPEPSTLILAALGLVSFGLVALWRRPRR